jgi:phosphotriesterase-related protein
MKRKIIYPAICLMMIVSGCSSKEDGIIMTVNGPLSSAEMGISLIHEHILVDFIGADSITDQRWARSSVAERSVPFLEQLRGLGCLTFFECTPSYLGRDPVLLKELSDVSGLNIITNTGYYGAGNNKYLPEHAFNETADQLAARWKMEWDSGIAGTGIKPGFIKIGVMDGNLSDLHRKLAEAAARTHLQTGMTIASHTGPATPAFEQLDILHREGVAPEAFIWVHAQVEKDPGNHVRAARMGAWISLDGVNDDNLTDCINMIKNLKDNDLLNKVLLSHDAGWYHPGEENGGDYRGYNTIFEKLVPLLGTENFSEAEIDQLLVKNPAAAFTICVHRIN